MKQIIKINNQNNQFPVDARELHRKLKVQTPFRIWIQRRISDGMLVYDVDYQIFEQKSSKIGRGRPTSNYQLSFDGAKNIALMERTEVGKQIRMYFIQVEKAYREGPFGELARRTLDNRTYIDYNGVLNLLQLSLRSGSYHRRIRRYRSEFVKLNNHWYVSVEFSRVIWQQTEVIKQRNKAALKTLEATIAEATQRHNVLKARQLEINLQ